MTSEVRCNGAEYVTSLVSLRRNTSLTSPSPAILGWCG